MSLKRQTVWSITPLLVVTVINIVSVPLFYRFLGPEMYALWFYVLTFTGAFGFMDLGLGVAVGRYMGVALGKGDLQAVREYWGTGNAIAIPLLAAMAIVFAVVGVVFGPAWFNVMPANITLLRWSFVVGGAGLFLSYYCQFWLILSQAHLDFKFLAILRTTISLAQVIPSIPLAWATRNPLVLILWSTGTTALQLLVFTWHARSKYQIGFSLRKAGWNRAREMSVYTGKTFAALLANSFLGSADRLILGKLALPADFAHYTICTNIGGRIQGFSTALMGPISSNASRSVGNGARNPQAQIYNESFGFTFPWYCLISIWAALWQPIFLRIWLGPELALKVGPILVPIIIGCCLTSISNISGAQLGALNRMGTVLISTICTGAFLVLGVYVGWLQAGIVGVAWGFLCSRAALLLQDLYLIQHIGAGGWLSLRTWKVFLGQSLFALLLLALCFKLSRDSVWNILPAGLHLGLVAWWIERKGVHRRLATWWKPSGFRAV